MPPSSQNRAKDRLGPKIDSHLHAAIDGLPEKVHRGVLGDNSAAGAAAKWRWTCSHVADVASEWPALLAATTTATPMLRADPSYATVALPRLAHAEKNSETACSRVTDESRSA